jgi:uncharacterized protein
MSEHKIIITGTVGAGKTTAIAAVSEIAPISTDVRNTDQSVHKDFTTVGLDYGELTLDNGEKLRLYGTPGQMRFDFMWKILAQGALGVLILIDNSRPDPKADLLGFIHGFEELIRSGGCVIAIGRTEMHPTPSLDDYALLMESKSLLCPIVSADVRREGDVTNLLELLFLQIEAKML